MGKTEVLQLIRNNNICHLNLLKLLRMMPIFFLASGFLFYFINVSV
jgi:hypothetical protein